MSRSSGISTGPSMAWPTFWGRPRSTRSYASGPTNLLRSPLSITFPDVTANFTETNNDGACNAQPPAAGAPVNPLGSACDDFALISGLDLTSIFIPANTVGNTVDYVVDFRLFAEAS